MDSLEAETIDVIPIVDKIGVPSWSKGIDGADFVMISKSCGYDPIFASLKNNDDSSKAFGVNVERADGASPPN